jgi:hypothetical protein
VCLKYKSKVLPVEVVDISVKVLQCLNGLRGKNQMLEKPTRGQYVCRKVKLILHLIIHGGL